MIEAFLTFYAAVGFFFSSLGPCFVIEKALSVLQKRKFNQKFAWSMWVIVFFGKSLVGDFVAHVAKSCDQRSMTLQEKIMLHKKQYDSS